ncbi:HSP20-like chaperone [Fimicolochytrium jonesii]|uniref:HSP20-like chaperone n=1 Tax=Fimicolochytrium jonesii TaxID=1396493 RepID=UPI0022FE580F|nr:HSP20-like chaperone [Fimicolochytrium jonesii]KAI8820663.1 HSP20-like chaperone [Fimicolochytrium jonesii]
MSGMWGSLLNDPFFNVGFPEFFRDPLLSNRGLLTSGNEGGDTGTGGALATRGGDQAAWNVFRGPRIDVSENEKEYVIKADLPGLKKEDINIHVEDNMLTLEGERKSEHEEKSDRRHIVERSFGRFRRSLRVPPDAQVENSSARMENGVLELTLPKNPAAEQRKRIDVQ